jgi:hypothetical protein
MSWGGGEFPGESSYDSYFSRPGVAFVASSGDSGSPIEWPASSPDVIAVGGTALTLGGGAWAGETGWSGSGGGPSAYEPQPSYQAGVVGLTSMRANPDVAYDASPSTGFAVDDSYAYSGTSYGWLQVGGTSAGAPQWAAILAIADQGRAATGQAALDSSNPQEVMTALYKNTGAFHDITSGISTGSPYYSAGPGYDYVTGLGSPMVNLVVGSLVGNATGTPTPTPAPTDTLAVSAPSTVTAGTPFSFTVSADNASGVADPNYTGTVRFTSTDGQAVLPASYTFTWADAGSHTFAVTLNTAGSQSVTVTDAASGQLATQSGINVSPAAPQNLIATAASSSQINLSWSAAAGDTGYQVERSSSGSNWTTIVTVSAGTTSYQDRGLSAAMTYSYRVRATGGNLSSAYSNTASATTAGAPTGGTATDTIWSNSYTPNENASAWGWYELGLKFQSSAAGAVTGVRFYKQSWMGGFTHVGHLWSSNGALLASATFTNETSYGWEQVSFSSPVAIQPNTTYIVSFSSGGGYFGISSGFFNSAGVTNGPLQALPNSTPGGNGVYQYAGAFPNVSGSGTNFWVDVAFSPSGGANVKGASVAASTSDSSSTETGRSGFFLTAVSTATASRPVGFTSASRGATGPAGRLVSVGLTAASSRRAVAQAQTPVSRGPKGTSFLS